MKGFAGVVAALAPLFSATAGQEDFATHQRAARSELVTDLEQFADWCHEKQLFLEQQKAFELLLTLDPDHASARKTLGFTRAKDGTWKAPAKPKAFRNYDAKALGEAPQRMQSAVGGYVNAMVAVLERPDLPAAEQDAAAKEALRFDPDNERVHALLGDVRGENGWVMPETLRAKERRAAMRGFVVDALAKTPEAKAVELVEREKAFGLPMRAVATPHWRVVGTVDDAELTLMVQALHGLENLLESLFPKRYLLPNGCTVFLLADPGEKQALIDKHRGIAPDRRAYYMQLEGAGIQGTNDFAFWTGDTQRRIDGVVRTVLGFWLSGAFEITVDDGWAYEGLGLVLTRALVRTRMTWMAQPSRAVDAASDLALRERLLDPATNWMDEALLMLNEKRDTPLSELLRKGASDLTTEDVLYSNALATYLLEAQADKVAPLLRRVGTGYAGALAIPEALGMDLEHFRRHLIRWLSERK